MSVYDQNKAKYAINKIKKASAWNKNIDSYNYLNDGLLEAELIISELQLEENEGVLEFLQLVASGKATIADLNHEILEWILSVKLQNKMKINFLT